MTDPVSVRAGWAIWGKLQGTREDYSVLNSSAAPLSAGEFGRVLAHFAPGSPPADGGAADSLPWVMLSRVGVAEEPYIGISIQKPAGYVDGAGRPVSRTEYRCVRYDDITSEPVSYWGLYQAISPVALPAEGGAQVPLSIPPLDPAALAREIIDEFGVEAVAATAALLLSGPVTITGPEFPDWSRRLRFLDAVAALLPYGYRAHYTASTWSDAGASAQRFRIVFALRAGDRSHGVPWGTVPQPKPGAAEEYYAYLRRTARPGGDIADLAALIRYLSRQTAQCKFDQPEHAVRVIRDFRPAGTIAKDVNTGAGDPGEIRDVFRQDLDQLRWDPVTRGKALRVLITIADPRDEEIIRTRFPRLADKDVRELLPAIVESGRRLLWSGEDTPPVWEYLKTYLESLRPFSLDDELLAALLVPPGQAAPGQAPSGPAPSDARLNTAAALADFTFANGASYRNARKALTDHLAVGTALIARLYAAGGETLAAKTIAWLAPDPAHVLRPFRMVLDEPAQGAAAGPQDMRGPADAADAAEGEGSSGAGTSGMGTPGIVSLEDVRDLGATGGRAAVRYLLRVASGRKTLRLVLPSVACWLCHESVSSDGGPGDGVADARSWQDAAMELAPADEEEAAWLDLVLLSARANPRSLLTGKYPALRFAHVLTEKWENLTATLNEGVRLGQFADDLLTSALVAYLRRADWRAGPAKVVVERLTDLLTDGGQRRLLANEVWNVETTLRRMPPQATVEQIARACAEACLTGLNPDQAARELAESGAMSSGERAAEVLGHVHWMAAADPRISSLERWDEAVRWMFRLAQIFANGTSGTRFASDFTAKTARISVVELTHHLDMLSGITASRAASEPPVLDSTDISRLRRAQDMLGELIENATGGGGLRGKRLSLPKLWRSAEDGGGDAR